jgi:hypothetical protein
MVWMIFQFCISVVVGSIVYWDDERLSPHNSGSLLAGLIGGLIAARAVMFLITWVRFGWSAARSMRMSG